MRAISRYFVQVLQGDQQCVLLRRADRPLALRLEGQSLEAEFELENGDALVCLTDDYPFEERLHIYLLDPDDVIQDALEAGAVYSPGILKIIRTGIDWLGLEFFQNDHVYRLEITPHATFSWPLPKGWRYKKRLRRHRLKLYEVEPNTLNLRNPNELRNSHFD